jgi:HlyD family secretion protein
LAVCFAIVWTGCGTENNAAESQDGDSTSIADAKGTMESDAENFGEGGDKKKEDNGEKKKEKKKKEKSTSVNASLVFSGDLVKPVIAEGTIRARQSAEIRTEIGGKITRVYANEGQSVRKGQLIVKVDDREYEVAAEEARANYLQALSLLSIEGEDLEFHEKTQEFRDQFTDLEKLERSGEITREERLAREVELDVKALKEGNFRLEIAAARSGVSVARTTLERARLNLERTKIRAPFSGVITGLTLSNGEQVTVNETICEIVDNVNLEADVGVLEADLGSVEVGRSTLLEIPALDQTINVKVDVVSPQFDRTTRTCQVLIRLNNPEGRIRSGMFARAIIAGETYRDRLLVPREAILIRDGRPLLFKVEDKRSKWLYVQLGEQNDNLVEITKVIQGGSLQQGDKVVVSDHLTLTHDAKVKVKKTIPHGDPWISFHGEDE